jgi:predicted transcriptional regulator
LKDRLSSKITEHVPEVPPWTFLTNHAHVLICIARDREAVLRDVAKQVGITERAVQRIIADLKEAGYILLFKEGRQNRYELALSKPLRHQIESNCNVSDFVNLIK